MNYEVGKEAPRWRGAGPAVEGWEGSSGSSTRVGRRVMVEEAKLGVIYAFMILAEPY